MNTVKPLWPPIDLEIEAANSGSAESGEETPADSSEARAASVLTGAALSWLPLLPPQPAMPAAQAVRAEAFRQLIEQSAVGVIVLVGSGIVYANPRAAQMFGFASPVQLIAMRGTELVAKSSRPDFANFLEELRSGHAATGTFDAVGLHTNGSQLQIELRACATLWAGNDAIGLMAADVTERREAEKLALSQIAELAHFDRICTLGQMSATIMHEIAQPLTALSIASGAIRRLLAQPAPSLDTTIRAAEAIDAEARRMRETVERIKQFASGNPRGHQDSWEVIDAFCSVEQALLITAPAFNAAGVERTLQCEIDVSGRQVLADQVQLGQIVVNLITNGLDSVLASGVPDGNVCLRLGNDGDNVLLDVIDNGAGVPSDIETRIFDPFFSTKSKGVGIGLAVCRSIVENFGGDLHHLPAAVSRGAMFRLRMPIARRG